MRADKKITIFFIIGTVLCAVMLSGCMSFDSYSADTTNVEKFIGNWTGNYFPTADTSAISILADAGPITLMLFSNGTYMTAKHVLHTWELKIPHRVFASDVNQIILIANNISVPFSYTLTENNTKLHLDGTAGEIWLTKQFT